ncbi:MAG: ATP-binding protein [Bacteroidota bacterium]
MDAFRLHPLTLRFRDSGIEADFWEAYSARMVGHVRWTLLLGVSLLLPYGFVDALIAPEYAAQTWTLRIGTTLALVGTASLLFLRGAHRYFSPIVIVATLVAGFGLVAVGWYWGLAGTYSTHSGIMVVLFFMHVLARMRFVHATLVGAAISIGHLVQLALQPEGTGLDLLEQSAALVSANAVGMFASYTLETYARRVFWQTHRLEARGEALREANAELTSTLDTLQSTQSQLVQSEKMAALGQLTAGIAHEIKNPLNFVTNFASLSQELVEELAEETDPDEREAILNDLKSNASKIEQHGRRADAIVASMMDHAREGSGEREPVALNDLVKQYAHLAYHSMLVQHPDATVTLEQRLAEDAGEVCVSHREIGRVLLNLLDNAFDATRERAATDDTAYTPTVTISTHRTDLGVTVYVEDNGSGMPESVLASVFEPFFTTKPAGEGTGLGLSLSHDIVAQGHGGTLAVESTEGEGTVFTVGLPTA